jgi:predicted nucleotidyltransferase
MVIAFAKGAVMARRNYFDVAKEFAEKKFPGALAVIAAGSVVRGEDTALSDIDLLVVLPNEKFGKSYHGVSFFQGWPLDLFVHNENADAYFIEKEKAAGKATLCDIIVSGRVVAGDAKFVSRLRQKAQRILDRGPKKLASAEIIAARYQLTDAIEDLPRPSMDEAYGALARLHQGLGDFYLRLNGAWGGGGKALAQILKKHDAKFEAEYERVFAAAYKNDDYRALEKLVDKVLAPVGGRLKGADFKLFARPEANLYRPQRKR